MDAFSKKKEKTVFDFHIGVNSDSCRDSVVGDAAALTATMLLTIFRTCDRTNRAEKIHIFIYDHSYLYTSETTFYLLYEIYFIFSFRLLQTNQIQMEQII